MPDGSDDILRVLEATDLVRLIGEQLPLKKKGREWACVCPFHDDHAPSMFISPTKQIYKCFACGAGGDALSFVKNYFKMDFREALQYLAERGGVTLTPWKPKREAPPGSPEYLGDGAGATKEDLAQANLAAAEFFRLMLSHAEHGKVGRDLLESRGVSPEIAKRFGLGLSPDRWDGLLTLIAKKNWDPRGFLGAGLLKTRETGGHYDGFRHRLMFPIVDMAGRTVAFGARKIRPEDEPKYLNSSESTLFNKSATLYALPLAAQAIKEKGVAVVVEGYMDAIACHQAGVCNVVATLGTALTRQGARMLERFCSRVILMFDGDNAGQRAADRAIEVLFESTLDVRIGTLAGFTDAKDPDELLKREGGREILQQVFDQATDALDYRFARLRQRLANLGMQQRATVIEEELSRLAELGLSRMNPVRQAMVVKRIAELAGIDERTVRDAVRQAKPRQRDDREDDAETNPFARLRPQDPREYALIVAACEPALLAGAAPDHARQLDVALPWREPWGLIARALSDAITSATAAGRAAVLRDVLSRVESEGLRSAIAGLAAEVDQTHEGDIARLTTTLNTKLGEAVAASLRDAGKSDDQATRLEALRRAHASPGWRPTSVPRASS